jgi:hypothetical protein
MNLRNLRLPFISGAVQTGAVLRRWTVLGCVLYALAGCSRHAGPAGAADPDAIAHGAPTGGSVCERHILLPGDVAGILSDAITGTKPLPGYAQSCEFTTASFPAIVVSVRPGLGRTTVEAWASGKMPVSSSPLTGFGDGAVWVDTLHEIVAQKNAILCDIQVRAGGNDLAVNATALPAAVGALCNKIFAAY